MSRIEPKSLTHHARHLRLDTLVRLRWLAVAGQSAAVIGVRFGLGFPLPFALCLLVIFASVWVNLLLRIQYPASHRLSDNVATALLAFDILQLAALLYLTGGLENPFAMLFLAPVLISATALTPERTLGLGLLAVGCATFLVLAHRPLPWFPGQSFTLPFLYVSGIWTAILLGTAFTGIYAWRVAEEARQLAQALAATELVLAREQHLSQLDGLAAAAAHELGTPLATIALVTKELSHSMPKDGPVGEDLRLLQEQVERCRTILTKLTSMSDEGEFLETVSLSHLVADIVEPQRAVGYDVKVIAKGNGPEPLCRRNPGVVYGLSNILDNATDFAESQVTVEACWSPHEVFIEIRDDGPGYAPDILLRVGEPYVTTRSAAERTEDSEEGGGLGLGLFIAKTLIERSGAELTLSNAAPPASGAIARIVWPRHAFERGAAISPQGGSLVPLKG
ncbi:ActS/PrrB/RegB family redox-sensitive histidine kinase [Microvirga arsenatis]|uniref:histidine kinase n=1 Tax=Microvirga arsenatis TaxID=2692265 RepID=A0ABW9YZM5_9HYPH|nr:ActS/PrrB/RegB family redox-sensitive histidine kinase [Microvirga arsenatis]NBJ13560.1 ActS/PrrB/RegB family redox-sensitive histidine kinase [Microvirga arsenatis]NBJ23869.1 ActS/PrrB/RegB family redox-sensitive histidine kinase [Microvirga arsenatis]